MEDVGAPAGDEVVIAELESIALGGRDLGRQASRTGAVEAVRPLGAARHQVGEELSMGRIVHQVLHLARQQNRELLVDLLLRFDVLDTLDHERDPTSDRGEEATAGEPPLVDDGQREDCQSEQDRRHIQDLSDLHRELASLRRLSIMNRADGLCNARLLLRSRKGFAFAGFMALAAGSDMMAAMADPDERPDDRADGVQAGGAGGAEAGGAGGAEGGGAGGVEGGAEIGGPYANYVLAVLVLVYVFNFIDRNILSILANDIKADLQLGDAEIGFLYGTVFAVFYALFGIPLGRLADLWVRKSLISVGLAFWSVMTALSGTARSFPLLAVFRIGVGVGEASATPAAFSMLADYFPVKRRATALSIYSSGVYIGAGIGVFLGGWILDGWSALFPDVASAPMGLRGWQVAFFIVGLPGILMAFWVRRLKEPVRGQSEGLGAAEAHPNPFREAAGELLAVMPPLTILSLARLGAGARGLGINIAAAVAIAGVAWWLVGVTGSVPQWVALGIGTYAVFSWAQGLALRDPPAFAMIFRCPTVLLAAVGFSSFAFITYGLGFWAPPFFQRVHGVSASEIGTVLGLSAALGGWIGVTAGGVASDRLKERTPRARLYIGLFAAVVTVPVALAVLTAENLVVAYVWNFVLAVVSPLWVGPAATTVNDLVLPRMRALASAFYIMRVTFVGLAMGPYWMGQTSDWLVDTGSGTGDALRQGMMLGLAPLFVTVVCLLLALRTIEHDEHTRIDRAREAGEVFDG
jgi:MFS family permease